MSVVKLDAQLSMREQRAHVRDARVLSHTIEPQHFGSASSFMRSFTSPCLNEFVVMCENGNADDGQMANDPRARRGGQLAKPG